MAAISMPLTEFLIAMLKADPGTFATANTAKLAAKYNLPEHLVAGYLRMGRGGA